MEKTLLPVVFLLLILTCAGNASFAGAKNNDNDGKNEHDRKKGKHDQVIPKVQPPLLYLARRIENSSSLYKTATLPPQLTKDLAVTAISLFGLGLLLLGKVDDFWALPIAWIKNRIMDPFQNGFSQLTLHKFRKAGRVSFETSYMLFQMRINFKNAKT